MRHTPSPSPHTAPWQLIKNGSLRLAAVISVGIAAFLCGAAPALAQTALGTAQSFAVLGAAAVTNTGPSVVTGDLGVSPGSAVTGFPPGIVVGGTIHVTDAVATQARADAVTAYNAFASMACNTDLTGQNLGGLTLTPGVYCFSSSAQLTGALMLDAQGNPDAVFIFKIGTTLTTASNSSVQVINGGQNCNVFWQVGSSATLGTTTMFIGSILAQASITLNTGASIQGRALALNGAVTMDNNQVTRTNCAPSLGVGFSPTPIIAGGVSTKTLTLINPNNTPATLTAPLTDNLPPGLVIAAAPNASNTCGGILTAPAGGNAITLTGGTIPGGAPGTCTVTVNVTAAAAGNYINTLPAGALQTTNGNNAAPAAATLTVAPLGAGPPLIGVTFSPTIVPAGSISIKTITLINPNNTPATLTAPLTDNLPPGLVVAAAGASTTCGGVVTAPVGGNTVTLTGGTIPAGAPGTCTVTVNVTAAAVGNFTNTLPAGALQTTNGNANAQASATLTVIPAIPVAGSGTVAVSDTKAGSVLVFPYYTSNAAQQKDTRITISNIGGQAATVHLFFIDAASCNQADLFLCLTLNASFSFKTSEYDPEATGWLLAVAVDALGRPVQNNGLIGNAFVNDGNSVGNYGAEAFRANLPLLATINNNNTATLLFDGVGYDAAPNQLAVEIQSPLDAAGQRIITVGMNGDLTTSQLTGAAQVGSGQVINGNEKPFGSFNVWLIGSCQAQATISTTSPRVPSGLGVMIPSGQVGTIKFNIGAGVGLLLTPRTANWKGIRTLHKLGVTTTATLTIPVLVPVC